MREHVKMPIYTKKLMSELAQKVSRSRDLTAGPGDPDPGKTYKMTSSAAFLKEHADYDVRKPPIRENGR